MLIDQNEITQGKDELTQKEWFAKEFENCFIDLEKEPPPPKPVISIGETDYNGRQIPNGIMTRGEMSIISAPSKSYKTFLKSHIASAFLKNGFDHQLNQIRGHRQPNDGLADFDTEQGTFHAWHTMARAKRMSGLTETPMYYPFKTRHLTPEERVDFIDYFITQKKHEFKPRLIFIDGIADLINDANDLQMSNYVAQKVMTWTDTHDLHVCAVIHNAFGTEKPTGHLGSVATKKAESVFTLRPEVDESGVKNGIVNVRHSYSRGQAFEDFDFEFDKKNKCLKMVSHVQDVSTSIDDFRDDDFNPF